MIEGGEMTIVWMLTILTAATWGQHAKNEPVSGTRLVETSAYSTPATEDDGGEGQHRKSPEKRDKPGAAGSANPLWVRLVEEGVAVDRTAKLRARLPKPLMSDGLSQAEQQKILAQVAGARPLEEFVRNAVVAPFAMEIVDVSLPEAPTPLRRVDVSYVAYGRLEQLFSEDFLEHLLHQAASQRKSRYPIGRRILSAEELAKRNLLLPPDGSTHKERYLFTAAALFDRVLLRTTQHVVVTRSEETLVLASAVAPAFQEDKEYPNQWQPIQVDDQGRFTLGPAQPYFASASYTKVTRLRQPTGALFIEHHHLFAEPNEWFGGKNFLRSKLPLAVQEAVRKLRWELRRPDESTPPTPTPPKSKTNG